METMFVEETEVCERAIRRLAEQVGCNISKSNGMWVYRGIDMDDDELWAVLRSL